MLRWMAPFLSFTAEEAWAVIGKSESIFLETYMAMDAPDEALLAKWSRIREIRDGVNKEIEVLRAAGQIGASLQADVTLTLEPADLALLSSLGADLKFAFITSALHLESGARLSVHTEASKAVKCARCWHYCDDVGAAPEHPSLCGRCVSNLFGAGETRRFA